MKAGRRRFVLLGVSLYRMINIACGYVCMYVCMYVGNAT